MVQMTADALVALCKRHELYITPHLNEQLYCNFQGFSSMEALQEYSALKSLFMEGNMIKNLDSMPSLPELRCLFLQDNHIVSLQGLCDKAPNLATLDVSNNHLNLLDIGSCTSLSTLLASNNNITSIDKLCHCTNISTLDLQNNKLASLQDTLDIISHLPELRCLYLHGNPFVDGKKCASAGEKSPYRQRVIAAIKGLTFLDDRPVEDHEREKALKQSITM